MNNIIIFDEIFIGKKEVNTVCLSNRLLDQDIRVMILCEYNKDGEFVFKKETKIKNTITPFTKNYIDYDTSKKLTF